MLKKRQVVYLVINMYMFALGKVGLVRMLIGAKFVQKVSKGIPKLNHALSWDGHL